jgi:hypothetical protein
LGADLAGGACNNKPHGNASGWHGEAPISFADVGLFSTT